MHKIVFLFISIVVFHDDEYYFRDLNQAVSKLQVSCITVGLTRSLTMGGTEVG
jgi:hypothetical protein